MFQIFCKFMNILRTIFRTFMLQITQKIPWRGLQSTDEHLEIFWARPRRNFPRLFYAFQDTNQSIRFSRLKIKFKQLFDFLKILNKHKVLKQFEMKECPINHYEFKIYSVISSVMFFLFFTLLLVTLNCISSLDALRGNGTL